MKGGIYRSRLGKDLDSKSRSFIGSLSVDSEFLRYEVASSLAHVVMLREKGWIDGREATELVKALRKAELGGVPSEGFEDIHEYIETAVIQSTSTETGGRLHTARSRNDQVATITRMMCRDRLLELARKTMELVDTLLEQSKRFSSTPLLAYTHLRQAQIQTLGHHLQSYADPLVRDVERLMDCYDRTNECPLGASAVAGSTLDVDRGRTSELLGFAKPLINCEDAVESRDYAVETVFVEALLLVELSRIAEDLILWSTSEFAYFELPDSLSSPSSAMPQKKNADVLEVVRADASLEIAELVQMLSTIKGLPSGYNRDLQSIKAVLVKSFATTLDALSIAERCVKEGSFNVSEMRRKAERSDIYALPLAEWLVRRRGVPFRQAHSIAGKASSVLVSRGESFGNLSSRELTGVIRQASPAMKLSEAEARELVKLMMPDAVLRATRTEGGPSSAQVLAAYSKLRSKLAELHALTKIRESDLKKAAKKLEASVKAFG